MKQCFAPPRTFLATAVLLAASPNVAWADFDPFFEILIMGGIATLDAEDTQLIINEVETDKLVQTNNGHWDSWTGQAGIAYVYPLLEELKTGDVHWFPVVNPQLNVYMLNGGNLAGDVYQFESSEFNNLDYTMDFDSTRLMLDLGLTIAAVDRFSLYAIAGAGIAWNNIDFEATPNQSGIDCGAMGFDLNSESSSSFAYEFGGGITYAAFDNVAISLEYLYTGFTDVALGDDTHSQFDIESSDMDINTQSVLLGLRFAL